MTRDPIEIVSKLSNILEMESKPLSISQLSIQSKLSPRTVKKYLKLIEIAKDSPDFRVITSPKVMIEPIGFLSLPEQKRISYLRLHYPEVEDEGMVLVMLYNIGAFSEKNGVEMNVNEKLKELIKAEHIKESNGIFFLTDLGKRVAEGTLKIYPELRDVNAKKC